MVKPLDHDVVLALLRAARRQARPRQTRHAGDGQDHRRSRRRGAGDDRHLRLRGRPLAPALRAHHRQRTAGAPADRAMASARPRRHHQRVQLPRGRLGLEFRARRRLRRRLPLEAIEQNVALRHRGHPHRRARLPRDGRGPRPLHAAHRQREDGRPTLAADSRVPLVSATDSCAMGKKVTAVVHARFGRTILELGGNNAVIVTPSADLDLALRAIVFGARSCDGDD